MHITVKRKEIVLIATRLCRRYSFKWNHFNVTDKKQFQLKV